MISTREGSKRWACVYSEVLHYWRPQGHVTQAALRAVDRSSLLSTERGLSKQDCKGGVHKDKKLGPGRSSPSLK